MDLTGAPGTLWGREPAAIIFLVEAVIIAVVAFGLDLTAEQIGAILLVTTAILGVLTRAAVHSPKSHSEDLAVARTLNNGGG